jgi:hypothetical protein
VNGDPVVKTGDIRKNLRDAIARLRPVAGI